MAAQKPDWSKAGQPITKDQARQMTNTYSRTVGTKKAHLFSSEALLRIINQKDAKGVRFWYAEENGEPTLVAVGVDDDGNDMEDGEIVELTAPCPPWCP